MAAAAVESIMSNGSGIASTSQDWPGRWTHHDKILGRATRFNEEFEPGQQTQDFLRNKCKILVIGAGGLGCEILANLAMLGFRDIHVIDLDTIDVSNLNRQFLFREKDVGSSKAQVAASYIMKRVPGCTVTPHHAKIQDFQEDYYMQFNLIVCGLDNVEARRWINATLVQMVDSDNPESLKPLIDGGTEGFKGQCRVILPTISACIECTIDLHVPRAAVPLCTLASTPRQPEHCIEFASIVEWPRVFGDSKKLDNDDPEHISWLYDVASKRANEFGIQGVTWSLTQGVVKNIIPAIASTNAIIAAASCNEAFKIVTSSAGMLNNYMQYSGTEGVYTYTFEYQQRPECPVCGGEVTEMQEPSDETLEDFIEKLKAQPSVQLKNPALSVNEKPLYWPSPPDIEKSTRHNLKKTIGQLFTGSEDVTVTDKALPMVLNLNITPK